MFDDITLFNEGTDVQNFDLDGDRTLSGGTLTFRSPVFNGMSLLRYSGTQTRKSMLIIRNLQRRSHKETHKS